MQTVGVRELKTRLSHYLRHVRGGETILVTDRGEVVAELLPPGRGRGETAAQAGLRRLAQQGLLSLAAPGGSGLYPALARAPGLATDAPARWLDEERGER